MAERKTLKGIKHGRSGYQRGCGCAVCRGAESSYQAGRRAVRGRTDGNVIQMPGKRSESSDSVVKRRSGVGDMERAVVEECEGLERAKDRPTLVVAARNLAKIVDNPELKGLHTSTTKQIMGILADLHGDSDDKRKSRKKSGGRLATVGNLTKVKRHA